MISFREETEGYRSDLIPGYELHLAHPCVGHTTYHRHNYVETAEAGRKIVRKFIWFEHRRNEALINRAVAYNVASDIAALRKAAA